MDFFIPSASIASGQPVDRGWAKKEENDFQMSLIRTYSRRAKQPHQTNEPVDKVSSSGEKKPIETVSPVMVEPEGIKNKHKRITDFFPRLVSDSPSDYELRGKSKPKVDHVGKSVSIGYSKFSRQTFLDLGQKGLNGVECKECGLAYDPSFTEDVRLHEKMHSSLLEQEKITSISHVCTWRRVFPNGHRVVEYPLRMLPSQTVSFVNRINTEYISAIEACSDDYLVYFYALESGLIVSLLMADKRGPDQILVERIWTRDDYRRRGYATRLLASLRRCSSLHSDFVQCTTGCFFSPSEMSFSHPTAPGRKLAESISCVAFHT